MEKLKAAIIIVSDTAAQDPSTDKSGKILRDVFADDGDGNWVVEKAVIIADDALSIQRELQTNCAGDGVVNLVVTTGGTGFATKDNTPEAVTPLIHRHAPGLV